MSAKAKILTSIGLLFSIIILIISIVGYGHFKSSSVSTYTDKLDIQSLLISQAVEQRMNRYFDTLQFLASELKYGAIDNVDTKVLIPTLNTLKKQLGVLNAYVGFKSGLTYSVGKNGLIPGFNARELNREWYIRAFGGEKKIITTPYTSASGNLVMAVAVPVEREGQVIAVLSVNLAVDEITNFITGLTENNQIFVSRKDGFILAAKYPDYIGKNLFDMRPSYQQYQREERSHHSYAFDGNDYFVASATLPELGWNVWAWDPWDRINEASSENLQLSMTMAVIFIATALVMIYLLVHRLMYVPIGGEPRVIEQMVQRVAAGDLTSAMSEASGKEKTGIYAAIVEMVNNLQSTVLNINTTAEQLNGTSTQMVNAAGDVNQRSRAQMEQLENTTASIHEMTQTVEDISNNAQLAASSAAEAQVSSQQGDLVVAEMNTSIGTLISGIENVQKVIWELESETERVGTILEVIRGIAEQTNLLALNAAIEAARAGDMGRGFAVVADEVRGLANRTQESTDEIQSMITNLQDAAKNSVQLMQANADEAAKTGEKSTSASDALVSISHSIQTILDMNDRIASASDQQTQVVAGINESISDINGLAKATFSTSENNQSIAMNLTETAVTLNKSVEIFKV